jgi:hypothetical protein
MGGNKRKLGFIPGSDNATTCPICWKETMTKEVGGKKIFEFGGWDRVKLRLLDEKNCGSTRGESILNINTFFVISETPDIPRHNSKLTG